MDEGQPPSQARDEAWRQEQQARMFGAWDMLSGILQAGMSAPADNTHANHSVPFIVITGFLGAGKTTLLNALLTQPHGKRLAVLVNDFGKINIDAMLVSQRTVDTISLSNGCTCCSLASDLAAQLATLTQAECPPDAIVLEASGLADPHGIAQVALANRALALEGIVAVVDAQAMRGQAVDPAGRRIFASQLAASDLIVLNKLALVNPEQHEAQRHWLHDQAGAKPVIEADARTIPFDLILGIHHAGDRAPAQWLTTPRLASHGYESVSLSSPGTIDDARFARFIETLPPSVVRAKGVLPLASRPGLQSVYQRVGKRWSIVGGEAWGQRAQQSDLVLIAPRGTLDEAWLQSGLDGCRTTTSL
ncbi:MAG: GTP-binding protein [Burkholderiales bacterium]